MLEILANAKSLHQEGRTDEAARLYLRVLDCDARQFEALLLLSVIEHQRRHDRTALELVDRALGVNAHSIEALLQRAMVLRSLNEPTQALASYDEALAIEPNIADALYNRGNLLAMLARHADALASYDAALALRPADPEALNNRAVTLQALGRFEDAVESCDRALAVQPRYAEALNNRGNALQSLSRHNEALASYDRALQIKPVYAEALNNRGNALRALGRANEALADYDAAIAVNPAYADALSNRGNALYELKRYEDALVSHERAYSLAPDASRSIKIGNALQALRRHEAALAHFERALEKKPDSVEALNNRGNALQALNRNEEALASYVRATVIAPDEANAHWNEGLARLLMGDYERGWEKYEWRWKNKQINPAPRVSEKPAWRGAEDIAGKIVLVHAEQGFGDAIQFIRYVPLLAARGANVLIACHESLRELFGTLEGVRGVVEPSADLPPFDYHVPLMSLPYAFKTTLSDIPARVPYLHATDGARESWRNKLGGGDGVFKVGIAWMGNPEFTEAHAKSCSLEQLKDVIQTPHCSFFSLQKGDAASDIRALGLENRIADHGRNLESFSDTAALIANLDLVISIDTAVAHLAGALGKPVWVLLPFAADWRWLLDRTDSPWYPTARLFRQPRIGDWESVVGSVSSELRKTVRQA